MSLERSVASAVLSVAVLCSLVSAVGASVTYIYTGDNYTTAGGGAYNTSMSVSGSFTFASALGINLSNFDALADVVSFTFEDGVQTYTEADTFEFTEFLVSTNESGAITGWAVELSKVPGGQPTGTGIATCNTIPGILATGVCASDALGSAGGIGGVGGGESLTSGAWTAVLEPDVTYTYTYAGNNFTSADAPFTTADSLSISITLSSPLPPNISDFDASGIATVFSFSNGVNVFDNFSATTREFRFTTDGTGAITEWAASAASVSQPGPVGGGSVSCQLGTSIITASDCAPGGPLGGTDHVDAGVDHDLVQGTSIATIIDSPGTWTLRPDPSPFVQTFEIFGSSTGVGWSWRIDIAGSTVAFANNVGPLSIGQTAQDFKNEFVLSINSNLGTSGCSATDISSNRFQLACPDAFGFFLADAAGTGADCLVTDTIGGAGCSFNPTIVQVTPLAVPTLGPWALLFLSGLILTIGLAVLEWRVWAKDS